MMRAFLSSLLLTGFSAPAEAQHIPAGFEWCYQVYTDVLQAFGRIDQPQFRAEPQGRGIATMTPEGMLVVTRKCIELCQSLGADSINAMALILGHELTHYYNRHVWALDFGSARFSSSDTKMDWSNLVDSATGRDLSETWQHRIDSLIGIDAQSKRREAEAEADEIGTFVGFVAGYNTFGVAERLFESMYEMMRWPDTLENYQPKQERIAVALKSAERAKKLGNVFIVGKLALALADAPGAYRALLLGRASDCFEYIITEGFAATEIYNNLAVCQLQQALSYKDPERQPFRYPTIADANSRLLKPDLTAASTSKGTGDAERIVKLLLQDAVVNLNEAIQLDPDYIPAYINMACANALQGELDFAKANANKAAAKAEATNNDHLLAYALEINGIIAALEGETKAAKKHFQNAEKLSSPFSKSNLLTLAGKELPLEIELTFDGMVNETANGLTLYKLHSNTSMQHNSAPFVVAINDTFLLTSLPQTNGTLHVAWGKRGQKELTMFETAEAYDLPAAGGLQIGATKEQLEKVYEGADRLFRMAGTTYHVYLEKGILFKVNDRDRVTGWVLFDVI